MFKKFAFIVLSLILIFGCSEEETAQQEKEDILQQVLIELDIENNVVISSDEIAITVDGEVAITKLEVLLDDTLVQSLSVPPYTFAIDTATYDDGTYTLQVEAYSNGEKVGLKTISVKIDNTGPQLNINNISNNEVICNETLITTLITDLVSGIKKIEVYLDDELLLDVQDLANPTFSIVPENLPAGDSNLKFIMEDILGNISKDSLNIKIAKKVISISFPDNFDRVNVDSTHIILSDADGNYLDSKTHSGQMETLEFCSFQEFDNDEEFMLSFVSGDNESIYSFYVYANLTKDMLGDVIRMPARTAGITPAFPDLDVIFYDTDHYLRASPPWGSMIYNNQTFSGHVSTTFSNEALGTNKTFVQYYDRYQENEYQWAFIDNIHTKFSLEQEDFTSENVVHGSVAVNGSFLTPFMSIYGFENEAQYNAISGHMMYWNPSLIGNSVGYSYSYADIFDYMVYSIKVKNYTIEGSGTPPSAIDVPNTSIDYTYSGNGFTFEGLPAYEVGRLRLRGTNTGLITPENPAVNLEFIFNGESTRITVPKIPEGLFTAAAKKVFDNQDFDVIQGAAENYSSLTDYKDYISKVLVAGEPFYKTSDTRERIFKSSVGTQLLPIAEYPFFERF